MALLTTREFSEGTKIKLPTIRQHIKRGLLFKNADGKIDTDNPINRKYIDERTDGNGLGSGTVVMGRAGVRRPVKSPLEILKKTESIVKAPVKANESVKKTSTKTAAKTKTDPKQDYIASKEFIEAQELQTRRAKADAAKAEMDLELKRIQLEKSAGKLLPVEIVEQVFIVNIQGIFKEFDNELNNIASIYVEILGGNRTHLAKIIAEQRKMLSEIIKKAGENGAIEIDNAVNQYQEVRSRGERK